MTTRQLLWEQRKKLSTGSVGGSFLNSGSWLYRKLDNVVLVKAWGSGTCDWRLRTEPFEFSNDPGFEKFRD